MFTAICCISEVFIIKNVTRIINESKKSRYKISKETNIPAATLSRIVNGQQKSMDLKTAFKLADALGVDINEFREDK